MVQDRRSHIRKQRLLKLRFTWRGHEHVGITTDISQGGAFINTTVYPEHGEIIEFVHSPEGCACEVVFRSVVRRVADPEARHSVLPCLGVSFDEVSSSGTLTEFGHALSKIFDDELPVFLDEDDRAVWIPGANDTQNALRAPSGFFRDLKALEEVLPDPTADRDETGETGRRAQRRIPRPPPEVVFYIRGVPSTGLVHDVSLRGMFIESDAELPAVGEVVTIRYPLPDPGKLEYARIVAAVVRTGEEERHGFAVAILRVHNMGVNATFEAHVAHLEARRAREHERPSAPQHTPCFRRGTRLSGRRKAAKNTG